MTPSYRIALAAVCLTCVQCGSPPCAGVPGVTAVNVQPIDVSVAPTQADGSPWDGPGKVHPQLRADVETALGLLDPYRAVVDLLASSALSSWEKPEPFGDATLQLQGLRQVSLPLSSQSEDSFTPAWDGSPQFTSVPLGRGANILVRLRDKDLQYHDDLGSFAIGEQELCAALATGTNYQVNVAEQTHKQVLFFGILVLPTAEASPSAP